MQALLCPALSLPSGPIPVPHPHPPLGPPTLVPSLPPLATKGTQVPGTGKGPHWVGRQGKEGKEGKGKGKERGRGLKNWLPANEWQKRRAYPPYTSCLCYGRTQRTESHCANDCWGFNQDRDAPEEDPDSPKPDMYM